jgi:hypothetical protein
MYRNPPRFGAAIHHIRNPLKYRVSLPHVTAKTQNKALKRVLFRRIEPKNLLNLGLGLFNGGLKSDQRESRVPFSRHDLGGGNVAERIMRRAGGNGIGAMFSLHVHPT